MLIRNSFIRQGGFNLIEVMVVITILGIVLGVAIPSYNVWIRNTQIRTAADSIQNGLQLARATAVQRNMQTEFFFTNADPVAANVGAAVAIAGRNWIVRSIDPVSGAFTFIEGKPSTEGTRNVQLTLPQASYVYTSLGSLTPAPAGDLTLQVRDTALSASNERPLNVVVRIGGSIRMCDPKLTVTNSTNPQAC